ncbi:hypothetical protein ADIARSV_4165 [Arcticibacter svalbardensis MN12-7]|uniref:Heparinase II/III-like protein n=1 Tax=Arcticibacter svalbardensis MN12-7 TaxID=1150600 RepID=R9GLS8_9SPHI|nr:heparinase II/III family protein [Arcticibacter svalbardensis]EOR92653.1 hypothetical protein ADIARSV_4165 [Arcticibacter svalbardensis MN12-7]
MKTILKLILIFLFISNTSFAKADDGLNITAYLKLANGDQIYPTAKQIKMLRPFMPQETFMPAPAYSDRDYWNKIANSSSGKEYLKEAYAVIQKTPEIPISDEVYREANKQGNRGMYKPKYYNTMERLEYFILAECLENKGNFIPQIETYCKAIMTMKSWMHPNHDDSANSNLEGKSIAIDLGARKFGSVLTLANILLADKLPAKLRNDISSIVHKRITASYLASAKGENELNKWIKATSNWNAVCTSGSVFSTIANSTDANERLAIVGSALNSMKYYLSGFGQDGYCSEGAGYWGYGFGHYLYLAQILSDYTHGKINLFDGGNPEKLKNVGNFPQKFEIQNSTCAPFADGVSQLSNSGSNFAATLSAAHYGAIKPVEFRFEEAVEHLIAWNNPTLFSINKNAPKPNQDLPNYSYFDDFGMVISRGKQKNPFSIAVKAGHNAENHNHSDVGTYVVFLGNDLITGDIGAPSYTAGAFSEDNPARSSWGHPLPRIDGKLQSNGRKFEGKITETTFTKEIDKAVMDISKAYEIPQIKKLVRTIVNNKSGTGTITIEDQFSATKPLTFGTAILTFAKYEIINSNTVILTTKNQKVKAEITSTGGEIKIVDEQVPVKGLRQGGTAYRIGIDFTKPINEGTIAVKYTPVNKKNIEDPN